ncbi:MAG TPA: hypothetical protein VHK69_17645 [Chitinophagaceae bacterium]|jgi:hypothetical protein|nr:hypothetical protein [Chitinophagaceae bacterium]
MDKEKQYDPARHNEEGPAPGIASVNTHNPGEERSDDGAKDLAESEADFDREEARRDRDTKNARGTTRMDD